MKRRMLVEAVVPSPPQIFDIILQTGNHKKMAWTA